MAVQFIASEYVQVFKDTDSEKAIYSVECKCNE